MTCQTTFTCICGQSHTWWHEHEYVGAPDRAPDRAHIIDTDPERDTSRCAICGQTGTYHRPPALPCPGPLAEDGMGAEQRRVLALLDSPDLLEDMAHTHYRDQWPAVDDWAEGTDMWRAQHRDNMRAALDVLRARIEEDR